MAALYRFTQQQYRRRLVLLPPAPPKKNRMRKNPVCREEPLCKAFIMAELLPKWLSGNHHSFFKGIRWFPDRGGVESSLFTACRPHRDGGKHPWRSLAVLGSGTVWEPF